MALNLLLLYKLQIAHVHPERISLFWQQHSLKNLKLEARMKRKRDENPKQTELVRNVDPDFVHVRSEQNLIRIGLFSAGLSKDDDKPASRTIRLSVKREGRIVDTSITYEGSRGLPTIACLNKWMGFQRIAANIMKREGKLSNPIKFVGTKLLREAGMSDAGKNYDALMAWGTRLAKTTITSSQVIYLANSRKYADETVGIFQKFRRVGQEDATGKAELYEVWLADWLLASLNSGYVYLEEFEPYLKLNRPIARGLYGFLHFWFSQNDGQYFEKDYLAICDLLDIKSYDQLSKAKLSLGPSLDELVNIGYLSQWNIEKRLMDEKLFKVEFWPGKEILKNLNAIDQEKQKKRPLLGDGEDEDSIESEILNGNLTAEAINALSALKDFGIHPSEAKRLLQTNEPGRVLDMIEYVSALAAEPGSKVSKPQGLLVSKLREGARIPSDFVTSRQRRARETARNREEKKRHSEVSLQIEYEQWTARQGDEQLARLYKGPELERKLDTIGAELARTDKLVERMSLSQRRDVARYRLMKEIAEQLMLPDFEEWCKEYPQRELFRNQ